MEQLGILLLLIMIGAAIGGFTNSLAIKMLFRPYQPKYFLNKRLPFTPGLIPKRHEELAAQLGRMVVDYLLTPEGIRNKFKEKGFLLEVEAWTKAEVKRLFHSKATLEEVLNRFGMTDPLLIAEKKLADVVAAKYKKWAIEHREQALKEMIPEQWETRVDAVPNQLTDLIIEKAAAHFSGEAGKQRINLLVDDFFENRGTLMNMIQMFMGSESLANRVQPEIIKFLHHKRTKETVRSLIDKELEQWLELTVAEMEQKVGGEEEIVLFLQQAISRSVGAASFIKAPVSESLAPAEAFISEKMIPQMVESGTAFLAEELERLMKKLHLQEVVRDQVQSFPVERLEQMVLSISRREFRLITILGALLGGIIGLFQGIIVLLIS